MNHRVPLDGRSMELDTVKADVSTPTPPEDFSLVLGGPLYQMYLRSRLVRPPADLMERRVIAFIVVTWFPLLGLTLAGGNALSGVTVPFLFDLDVHVRFLLALPLLIGAELLVHQRLGIIGSRIWYEGMKLPAFQIEIVGAVALLMVIALAPLTLFVLKLARAKREGARQYGLLATRYVDEFHKKWMRDQPPERESLIGSPDIQSLADLPARTMWCGRCGCGRSAAKRLCRSPSCSDSRISR